MNAYRNTVSAEIEEAFLEARQAGSYLAAKSDRLCRALRTRTSDGSVLTPFPRVFVTREYWKTLNKHARMKHLLKAIHTLHPGWIFMNVSAAVLHDLQVPYRELDGTIHIAAGTHCRSYSKTPKVTRHALSNAPVESLGGIAATALLPASLDCMRTMGFRHGTAIADSALRKGRLSREELTEYVEQKGSRRLGVGQARKTAAFADPRSANGGESVARAVMYELGFAAPDLQRRFRDPVEPWRLYYADFTWDPSLSRGTKRTVAPPRHVRSGEHANSESSGEAPDGAGLIVGELDGAEKYFNVSMNRGEGVDGALLRERKRESRLTLAHASVVRFSYGDVLDLAGFNHLLETYGVPRDHKPTIKIPPLVVDDPCGFDYLPPEAYA